MKKVLFVALMAWMAIGTASAQQDWANYRKYEQSNREIKAQPNNGRRVIFFGNSITENWGRNRREFFTDNDYICRGIGGQTSYQLLLRFREDVIALKPKVVVLNGCTNDIAENNHPYVEDRTVGNVASMCEIAKANGVKVILTTVTPCDHYGWKPDIKDVPQKIQHLNERLREYAQQHKILFVDYWTPMADERGHMQKGLTDDGCHPTNAGYAIMEPLIKKAIKKYVK